MKASNSLGTTFDVRECKCLECGYVADMATGEQGAPQSGDAGLCFNCGSLNIFDDHLGFRAPTDDELFMAARDSKIQKMRRAILAVKKRNP